MSRRVAPGQASRAIPSFDSPAQEGQNGTGMNQKSGRVSCRLGHFSTTHSNRRQIADRCISGALRALPG